MFIKKEVLKEKIKKLLVKVKNKKLISISAVVLFIIVISIYFKGQEDNGFEINTILLKSSIKQGEFISNNLKITNTKNFEQNFQIDVRNLEDFVFLSENNFNLDSGERKNLRIEFRDNGLRYGHGVYVGELVVGANSGKREIPIILGVQSEEIRFATNLDVSPGYKEVKPGEKISVGVKVFNLKDSEMHTVEMEYIIKNFNGDSIISETENIVVGTESLITKTITLPKDINLGNYVFITITRDKDSVSSSSYLFSVVKEKVSDKVNVNSFAFVILIFLFGVIGLIVYMIHDRNRLFLDLRRQQLSELKFYRERVKAQKKLSLCKAKNNPGKRKKIIKEFREIRKRVVRKIKKRHRKQRKEFKKIKKKSDVKKKLGDWKKQGFNVNELLVKMSKPTKKGMENMIKEWKKQGFNTSILKKVGINRKI